MALRGSTELQRLIRVWLRLGYPRRQAERFAREDVRVSAIWRTQGMTQADVDRALAKLRGVRDLFIVDEQGRIRPADADPPSTRKRKNRTRKGGA